MKLIHCISEHSNILFKVCVVTSGINITGYSDFHKTWVLERLSDHVASFFCPHALEKRGSYKASLKITAMCDNCWYFKDVNGISSVKRVTSLNWILL